MNRWLDIVVAIFPIALLIYMMTRRKSVPSNRALPVAAIVAYLTQAAWFGAAPGLLHAAVLSGLLSAFTPILIVWGAILLFRTMEASGAMNTVRAWLNGLTQNRVGQVMLVAWSFSFLIEGASGFGTPAALAAPLLVGLGFRPLEAATLCLIMNTVPVSFGAVGMPTWFGLGSLGLASSQLLELGFKTAGLHAIASTLIPVLALRLVFDWREIRENLLFILLAVGASVFPLLIIARFNVEFPALAGGFVGLIVTVVLARRGVGLKRSTALIEPPAPVPVRPLIKALFPLWGSLLLLLLTRIDALGIKRWLTAKEPSYGGWVGTLGELRISTGLVVQLKSIFSTPLEWSHALLYVPSILPFLFIVLFTFLLFRVPMPVVRQTWNNAYIQVRKPLGAFLGAMVFARLLMLGGERSGAVILGEALAHLAGPVWTFAAAYLGALGSFFSGSNTVSNLTFGGIQDSIAQALNLNRTTILALQNVGGAMGNMVCIHNIVAVCSVVGLKNQEGAILKRAFVPMLIYGVLAGVAAFLFGR